MLNLSGEVYKIKPDYFLAKIPYEKRESCACIERPSIKYDIADLLYDLPGSIYDRDYLFIQVPWNVLPEAMSRLEAAGATIVNKIILPEMFEVPLQRLKIKLEELSKTKTFLACNSKRLPRAVKKIKEILNEAREANEEASSLAYRQGNQSFPSWCEVELKECIDEAYKLRCKLQKMEKEVDRQLKKRLKMELVEIETQGGITITLKKIA